MAAFSEVAVVGTILTLQNKNKRGSDLVKYVQVEQAFILISSLTYSMVRNTLNATVKVSLSALSKLTTIVRPFAQDSCQHVL